MKTFVKYFLPIYKAAFISSLIDESEREAKATVRGCRNQREAIPNIMSEKLHCAYTIEELYENAFHCTDLREGDCIVRKNGRKYSGKGGIHIEYRQELDYVKVSKICDSIIIGTCGERVRKEQIICAYRREE